MSLSARANKTLMIKLAAAASTYGFTVLMTRTMGLEDFGTVAFFLNLALFLSVVGARGQQIAILRFVPELIHDHDHSGLARFVDRATGRAMMGALVVAVLAAPLLMFRENGFGWKVAIPGLMLIVAVGWIDIQSHVARAQHFLALALLPKEVLWRLVAGAFGAAFFASGVGPLRAETMLWILFGILAIFGHLQWLYLRRKRRTTAGAASGPAPIDRRWCEADGPFWLTSVSNIFLANADVLAVGMFAGAPAAGLYFVANRLAMFLAFFQTSTNVALGPMLAKSWAAGNQGTCVVLLNRAAARATLPTVLAGAGLFILAPQVLLVFGPDFAGATTALRLLVLAAMANAAGGAGDIALNMCGFHRQAMWASAGTLVTSAILLASGAAFFGVTGTAGAVLGGTLVRKVVFWELARHCLNIRTDVLAKMGRRGCAAKLLVQ